MIMTVLHQWFRPPSYLPACLAIRLRATCARDLPEPFFRGLFQAITWLQPASNWMWHVTSCNCLLLYQTISCIFIYSYTCQDLTAQNSESDSMTDSNPTILCDWKGSVCEYACNLKEVPMLPILYGLSKQQNPTNSLVFKVPQPYLVDVCKNQILKQKQTRGWHIDALDLQPKGRCCIWHLRNDGINDAFNLRN